MCLEDNSYKPYLCPVAKLEPEDGLGLSSSDIEKLLLELSRGTIRSRNSFSLWLYLKVYNKEEKCLTSKSYGLHTKSLHTISRKGSKKMLANKIFFFLNS